VKYEVWKETAASESVGGVFSYLGVFDLPKGLYPAGESLRREMEPGDRLLLIPKKKKHGAGIVYLRTEVEIG
jgi:hypothetical protein